MNLRELHDLREKCLMWAGLDSNGTPDAIQKLLFECIEALTHTINMQIHLEREKEKQDLEMREMDAYYSDMQEKIWRGTK